MHFLARGNLLTFERWWDTHDISSRFRFFLSEVLSFFFFCTFDNSVIKSKQASKASKHYYLPLPNYLHTYIGTFLLSNTDFKKFEKTKNGPGSNRIRQTVYEFSFRKG